MANSHRVTKAPAEELPADLLRLAAAIHVAAGRVFAGTDSEPWSASWKARNDADGF